MLLFLKHNQRHSVANNDIRIVIVVAYVRRRNVVIAENTRTADKPVVSILPANHPIPIFSICIITDCFPAFTIENSLSPFKGLFNPVSHPTIKFLSIRLKLCNSFVTVPFFLRNQGIVFSNLLRSIPKGLTSKSFPSLGICATSKISFLPSLKTISNFMSYILLYFQNL